PRRQPMYEEAHPLPIGLLARQMEQVAGGRGRRVDEIAFSSFHLRLHEVGIAPARVARTPSSAQPAKRAKPQSSRESAAASSGSKTSNLPAPTTRTRAFAPRKLGSHPFPRLPSAAAFRA